MVKRKGIDVSSWQGAIDWAKVKSDGVEFAMIRAGWGTGSADKYFAINAQGCAAQGIPFGVYWFIYCTDDASAKKNANACIQAAKDVRLTYPICCDFEYDSVSYANRYGINVNKDNASRWVKIFLETVKAAGYNVANYTNLDFLNRYFTNEIKNNYDLWYAYWALPPTWTASIPGTR